MRQWTWNWEGYELQNNGKKHDNRKQNRLWCMDVGTADGPAPQLPGKVDGQSKNTGTHISCGLDCYQGHVTLPNIHTVALGEVLASCVIYLVNLSKWPMLDCSVCLASEQPYHTTKFLATINGDSGSPKRKWKVSLCRPGWPGTLIFLLNCSSAKTIAWANFTAVEFIFMLLVFQSILFLNSIYVYGYVHGVQVPLEARGIQSPCC